MAQTAIKLIDTHRKVVWKFTGTGDASGRVLKIDTGSLYGALNANSQLLGAGTDRLPTYRLLLKSIEYDIGSAASTTVGSFLEICNDSNNTSNTILTLSPNSGRWPFNEGGEPIVIDCANPNGASSTANGNIYFNIQLTGTSNSYTVIMDFRKDPTHYDQGQFTDPMAFNRSPRGVNG